MLEKEMNLDFLINYIVFQKEYNEKSWDDFFQIS